MVKFKFMSSLLFIGVIGALSCTSVTKRPDRSLQLEKEKFRYTLPIANEKPSTPQFPIIKKGSLKNGLTVMVVEQSDLPIVDISVVFKNGSAFDPYQKAGLINMSVQMLKEGTKDKSSLELTESFANLGTEVSASSAKDFSFLSAAVLSNKTKEVMSLLANMVMHPRFDEKDFLRIRQQKQSSLTSSLADPSYRSQIHFLKAAYGANHPYAHPSAGMPETIKNISLSDVKEIYKKDFGPNNASLIVIGDVSFKAVMADAEKLFGNWSPIKKPEIAILAPTEKKLELRVIEVPHMPQSYVLVGRPVAKKGDPDLPAYEVFLSIIASDPTSRLNAILREEKGWTYGVRGTFNPLKGPGPVWISTSIQIPYGKDALDIILSELENLKHKPVSDDELKSAKEGILNSFASRYNTISKVSQYLADIFVYDLPFNYDEIFYNKLASLTKNDIMKAAERALKQDGMVAVALGDLEAIEPALKDFKAGTVIIERINEQQEAQEKSLTINKPNR